MEEQVYRLVQKAWVKYQEIPPGQRLLISISGIPGSGKTTLATIIAARLNARSIQPLAAAIPMDGYHLTRAQLDAFPDPATAHARRGAAFTFDAPALLALVRAVREPVDSRTPTIFAPSFSHARKDPVVDDIAIPPTARILIFEGNYLSLNRGLWRDIAALFDERWFVEIDPEVAGRRLVQRHVAAGLAQTEAEAWKRVRENDLLNGVEIVAERANIDEIITSQQNQLFAAAAS